MKHALKLLTAMLLVLPAVLPAADTPATKPNIIIFLADDMGYGDTGFNGCKDIPTPNIDSIARNGVRFTAGYVTAPQCAPSRSGLLSGRYQNRFGCEVNPVLESQGITRGVKLFGDYLHPAGYRTGMVGKWHLGAMEGCHPLERGFDSFFGFLGGSSHYLPQGEAKTIQHILEGREPRQVGEYLTGVFGDQAIRFIESRQEKPFALYLAFNAPHTPQEAPESYLARFGHITDPKRMVYAAMVSAMDDTIGRVLDCLKQRGIADNTLIAFLSDNGGPVAYNGSNNGPLRGVKGDTLEGGIRVPFVMQWKAVIPAGQTIDAPVSSLDLLPTALVAAGAPPQPDAAFDGINLLPMLTGKEQPRPRTLMWRFPFPPGKPDLYIWAVRQGDYKLVKWNVLLEGANRSKETRTGLFRMSDDIAESNDLSSAMPEQRQQLQAIYDTWNAMLPPPSDKAKESPKAPPTPNTAKPALDRATLFSEWDKNGDGALTPGEYRKGNSSPESIARFKAFDMNGDGKLSRSEYVDPKSGNKSAPVQ
jgi:arylsulfatase A-like enzyme